MKRFNLLLLTITAAAMLIITGCNVNNINDYDTIPPAPPKNVSTVTGDNRVDIYWDDNTERDLAGYNVYYAYSYDGKYTLLGSTQQDYFIDDGARNGVTYYYAVTAYDYNGNESELSYDEVYDTPRPEGFDRIIYDYLNFPGSAGYSFAQYKPVPYDDQNVDFFFENYNGTFYLDVWAEADIQDMGQTQDIYDVTVAPTDGWAPLQSGDNIKYVNAIAGHTYVIWTVDNTFAKIRISQITSERIVFDWAYQTVPGNRELKTQHKSRNGFTPGANVIVNRKGEKGTSGN